MLTPPSCWKGRVQWATLQDLEVLVLEVLEARDAGGVAHTATLQSGRYGKVPANWCWRVESWSSYYSTSLPDTLVARSRRSGFLNRRKPSCRAA